MKDYSNETFTNNRQPIYQSPVTGIVPFRVSFKSHGSFCNHWHSEIEIFYLTSGSPPITVYIEEIPYYLSERNMLIIPSTAVHRIEVSNKNNKVLRIDIGYPLLGENFNEFAKRRFLILQHSFQQSSNSKLNTVETIFQEICHEKLALSEEEQDKDDFETVISRMHISSQLIQIAAILLETIPSVPLSDTETQKHHAVHAVQSIIFYVQNHYNESITLDKAAVMAGYEKTHFCQLFKNVTGSTFHQYLTQLRLKEAIPLIRDTKLPITSIAQSVGISNLKTFSRLLKQNYGISANEIRKQKENINANRFE